MFRRPLFCATLTEISWTFCPGLPNVDIMNDQDPLASFRLDGKVALATGAARGIGFAIARAWASVGATVAIQDIDHAAAHEAVDQLVSQGHRAIALVGDLADLAHVESLIPTTVERLGRLDILLNNGGVQSYGFFDDEQTAADVEKQFRVNVTVPMLLIRQAAKVFIARGEGGRIINVSSVQSFRGVPQMMPYSVSKAALNHVTSTSARYLAGHAITVNAIAPGVVNTLRNTELFSDGQRVTDIQNRIPMKRPSTPQDIIGAALLLASRAGEYITGQTLFVDGGLSIR